MRLINIGEKTHEAHEFKLICKTSQTSLLMIKNNMLNTTTIILPLFPNTITSAVNFNGTFVNNTST